MTAERAALAEPEGRTRPGTSASKRDSYLDNAKFLLITLVVVGHAVEPLLDLGAARALYYWMYFFHMPAFILVSGYLARSFDGSPARVEKLVLSVAVPYLIFWGIHHGIYAIEHGELRDTVSPLQPTWTLWFLVALFLWRLSVPVWRRFRYPLIIAVLISVSAATVELGPTLSVGRVLSFLPFFVLGLCLRREHFAWLARTWMRVVSLVFLAVTVLLAVPLSQRLDKDWLYWSQSLTDRDIDPLLPSFLIRLSLMGLGLLMTVAFLALVPRRHTWFTIAGKYTMYVFLLHPVIFILLKASPWYDSIDGWKGLAVTILIGLALVPVLSSSWVRRCTRWAVEPGTERRAHERVAQHGS
ncbi:acyltransferase family protein [Nocardiopsis halotolerans]|uniref:acyltransferase family protein n=1 Tax=Nocardiopsis halotolerans TaxID=124252 RepID=UPI000365346B|nr:acyltransferase family protein [Nocardiopsis halotolerans]